jgi:hypothetical protein
MEKKTFTIFGNCQISLISYLLDNKSFIENYQYIQLPAVFSVNQSDMDNLYKVIRDVDLLIIQPINKNFNNIENLGTYDIISKTKPSCKIILFPSLHFSFYNPFSSYRLNKKTNKMLQQPIDYHDSNLINICKTHSSFDIILEKFKDAVNNKSIIDKADLEKNANESINHLKQRETDYPSFIPESCKSRTSIIYSSDFIVNNYKSKLLFYSMNHPTKHLFHYICDTILTIINIPLCEYTSSIDPLIHNNVPILYRALEGCVDFDISTIPIVINAKPVSIEEFVKIYYDIYSKLDLSEY